MMQRTEPNVGVSLDELLPRAARSGAGPVRASSCSTDWREVEPGDVFVALPDADARSGEGHQHARRAVSHGAIAVVCEQPVPVFNVPTYLVPDSRVALGELCQALVDHPTRRLAVVGVTGTHGKTTTIALLDSIFAKAGPTPVASFDDNSRPYCANLDERRSRW